MHFKFFGRIVRHLFFAESNKMIRVSRTRYLEVEDAPPLPQFLVEPAQAPLQLDSNWRLLFSLFRPFRQQVAAAYLILFVSGFSGLLIPWVLQSFIESLFRESHGYQAAGQALLLASLTLFVGLGAQHFYYRGLMIYQQMVARLSHFLLNKTLAVRASVRQKTKTGDMINFYSTDIDAASDMAMLGGDLLWIFVLFICFIGILFYKLASWALVPIGILALVIPASNSLSRRLVRSREQMQLERDQRLTMVTQVFSYIRIVKAFVWERGLSQQIEKIRERELAARAHAVDNEVWSVLIYQLLVAAAFLAHLAVMAHTHQQVNLAVLFGTLALYGLIEEPLGKLSFLVSELSSSWVSLNRIRGFLLKPEKEVAALTMDSNEIPSTTAIKFEKATLSYPDQDKPVLHDFDLSLEEGKSLAIVGAVGSGKSTVLLSLLNEIECSSGAVQVSPTLSLGYVPQESFLLSGSFLENLIPDQKLFCQRQAIEKLPERKEFILSEQSKLLDKAISVCQLQRDLDLWPDGFATEIGEKGVNLSGGQKTRVTLARVMLLNPDLILLDDPLAAVDINTERHLVDKLIFGEWKNKSRVLVTHRLEHLKRFDKILFLKKNSGARENSDYECGSFAELFAKSTEFRKFLGESQASSEVALEQGQLQHKISSGGTLKLLEEEERVKGAVGKRNYYEYFAALTSQNASKLTRTGRGLLLLAGSLSVVVLPLFQKIWVTKQTEELAGISTNTC